MRVQKICMIGDFAVGKTSLVSRYVHSTFSEQYLTTVGVKVDSRILHLASGDQVKLVLWDIAGSDALSSVERTYLQGAAGYLLVSDITRRETFDTAVDLQSQTEQIIGPRPFVMLMNKQDLTHETDVDADKVSALQGRGWRFMQSSAKMDTGVAEAFAALGERL